MPCHEKASDLMYDLKAFVHTNAAASVFKKAMLQQNCYCDKY
jgi:hypothetical protein